MKRLVLILPALIALIGCGTPQNQGSSDYPLIGMLYTAAGSGTVTALKGHPERRSQFEQVAARLETLAASTNGVSSVSLSEVFALAPVKQFQSERGRFLVLAAGGLAYQFGFNPDPLSLIQIPATPGTARAIAAGIRNGLLLSQ